MTTWTNAARAQARRFSSYALLGVLVTFVLAAGQLLLGIGGPYAPGLAWAALCVLAALQRHALAWSLLVLIPLGMICLQWLTSGYPVRAPDADPFGIQFATIAAFIFAATISAVTGAIFIIAVSHERAQLPGFRGTSNT